MKLSRSLYLMLLLAGSFAACQPKPTAEEVAQQEQRAQQAAAQAATQATPKPGSWMFDKNQRNTSLEKKAR